MRLALCTLFAAFTLLLAPTSLALELEPGPGKFTYPDSDGQTERDIDVFYHAPEEITSDTPVWFVIHGWSRAAEAYRDSWNEPAEEHQVLLLVPHFTRDEFRSASDFNFGRVLDSDDQIRPQNQWTYAIVDRLFEHVRDQLDLNAPGYLLYGFSAGSQFAHRKILLSDATHAKGLIFSNAGSYMMPDRDVDYPFGLAKTDASAQRLRRALQVPAYLLLGDEDNDPDHSSLPSAGPAQDQGPHRFARGKEFFSQIETLADDLNVSLQWDLVIAEGVDHSLGADVPVAAELMHTMQLQLDEQRDSR